MSSAICFNLDKSKTLLYGNWLNQGIYNTCTLLLVTTESLFPVLENKEHQTYPEISFDLTDARINSLPNNKILYWSKLKTFADDNSNVVQTII